MWAERELLLTLARKEFFVKYRRASFGVLWAVGLPTIQAVVLIAIFSRVVRVETGVDYIVFVFSGMAAWSYFSSTMPAASTAVVDNSGLASKIYFPRAVLPLITIGANLYGFVVTLAILVGMCVFHLKHVGVEILLLVPGTLLLVLLTTGMALLNSALHVYFRDLRFIIQATLMAWFYITPIFYPARLATGVLHTVIIVNPITGVVELMRAATVGADTALGTSVAITAAWALAALAGGLFAHRRYDRLFTDLL